MNNRMKFSLWYVLGAMLLISLFQSMYSAPGVNKISYAEFLHLVEEGRIESVTISEERLTAKEKGDAGQGRTGSGAKVYLVNRVPDPDLVKILKDKGVNFEGKVQNTFLNTVIFGWLLPIGLMIAVWSLIMRRMGGGGAGVMAFGKAKARIYAAGDTKTTFADVAGADEAKEELQEVVEFLPDPERYSRLGGRIPKGLLMVGAPGTGKTLLAKAVAGEAKVPFYSISGSGFVEMFVGVGASRVRDLFAQATQNAPCIIFIDEIDALGRARGGNIVGGNDEREQTLNQLLAEMDGFETNKGVIILAATNRPEILDAALLRAGRFDRHVLVDKPDIDGREAILKVHSKKTPLEKDIDMAVISRGTPGFSGADLANLVNEAALLAARRNADALAQEDFDQAKDKVLMGVERKSSVISDSEKRTTAYHEAGHALVPKLIKGTDPVHKVTIIPRGRALGLTMQLPMVEKYTHSKAFLKNSICILFGGRGAEKLVFDEITTGAGNDLERATQLARKMVCEWGMSEELGPLTYGKKEEQIFLGREIAQHRDFSEETARQIDSAVKEIILEAIDKVTSLLESHRDVLERMASELLEKETIVLEDIKRILAELRPDVHQPNGDAQETEAAKKSAGPAMTEPPIPEPATEEAAETPADEEAKENREPGLST